MKNQKGLQPRLNNNFLYNLTRESDTTKENILEEWQKKKKKQEKGDFYKTKLNDSETSWKVGSEGDIS